LGFLCHKLVQLNLRLKVDLADLEFLNAVYVEFRYPPDIGFLLHGEPSKEDAHKAWQIARRVYTQIEKMLEGGG